MKGNGQRQGGCLSRIKPVGERPNGIICNRPDIDPLGLTNRVGAGKCCSVAYDLVPDGIWHQHTLELGRKQFELPHRAKVD